MEHMLLLQDKIESLGAEPIHQYGPLTEMESLKEFLKSQTEASVFRHGLGVELIPNAPRLLDHAVFIVLDCESYERDQSKLTEIGFATFSVQDMHLTHSTGPHGLHLLEKVYFYHHRIAPNAHLINNTFVPGDPTKNRFGHTRFLSMEEAKAALGEAFNWPIDGAQLDAGVCPIIFVGHAVRNDIIMLERALGFDSSLSGAIVKTIDTQNLARFLGVYTGRGHQISLRRLCESYSFEYRDTHTAGNDAAYTLFGAVSMLLNSTIPDVTSPADSTDDDSAATNTTVEETQLQVDMTPQEVVVRIELLSKEHADYWGASVYCERCDSYKHVRLDCRARVTCKICLKANRHRAAHSHKTNRCHWT